MPFPSWGRSWQTRLYSMRPTGWRTAVKRSGFFQRMSDASSLFCPVHLKRLWHLCQDQLRRRYPRNPPAAARERLEYELNSLQGNELLCSILLTIRHLTQGLRRKGYLTAPGRPWRLSGRVLCRISAGGDGRSPGFAYPVRTPFVG